MTLTNQELRLVNSSSGHPEQMLGQQPEVSEILSRSSSFFKKDLLWKPLVRRFRRYLKKEALPADSYTRIFAKPVA